MVMVEKLTEVERSVLRAAQGERLWLTDGGQSWMRFRTSNFRPRNVTERVAGLAGRGLVQVGDRPGGWLRRWVLTEAGKSVLSVAGWYGGFPLVLEERVEPGPADEAGPLDGYFNDWLFRVKVSDGQAVIGYPRLSTIGVGFAVESDDDFGVDAPYDLGVEEIWAAIRVNAGGVPEGLAVQAIRIVADAAAEARSYG